MLVIRCEACQYFDGLFVAQLRHHRLFVDELVLKLASVEKNPRFPLIYPVHLWLEKQQGQRLLTSFRYFLTRTTQVIIGILHEFMGALLAICISEYITEYNPNICSPTC